MVSAIGMRGVRDGIQRRRMLLLVVALGTAIALVWLLGRSIDQTRTAASDAQLAAELEIAHATLNGDVAAAAQRAAALARLVSTQAAFARGDALALRTIAVSHPDMLLVAKNGAQGGSLPALGVERVVEVVYRGNTIGRIVTAVPLDSSYLRQVEAGRTTGSRDPLLITDGGRVAAGPLPQGTELSATSPADVNVAGKAYRALTTQIAANRPQTRIVVLGPQNGSGLAGWRLPLAVLATLAALFLFVFWLAGPLRRRGARAREPAKLGGVELLGETLAATHDTEALLAVILDAAIEATGAASGRLLAPDETPPRGALVVPLDTDEPGGSSLVLFPPRGGFTAEAAASAYWLGAQAAVAVKNARLHQLVEERALTDDLTGLANRRRFTEALTGELSRAERFGTPVTLLLGDLDGFKLINDRLGHLAGDEALRTFARAVQRSTREIDLAARIGGDEFAVLLPETDAEGARQVAERIRLELREAGGLPEPITASYGVAEHIPSTSAEQLLAAADRCLYEAKAGGRDMVVLPRAAAGQELSG
jgi:diguanylate cyclase (GGDEF)-like protein